MTKENWSQHGQSHRGGRGNYPRRSGRGNQRMVATTDSTADARTSADRNSSSDPLQALIRRVGELERVNASLLARLTAGAGTETVPASNVAVAETVVSATDIAPNDASSLSLPIAPAAVAVTNNMVAAALVPEPAMVPGVIPAGGHPLRIPTGRGAQTHCARGEAARLCHTVSEPGEGSLSTLRRALRLKQTKLRATAVKERKTALARQCEGLALRIQDITGEPYDNSKWSRYIDGDQEEGDGTDQNEGSGPKPPPNEGGEAEEKKPPGRNPDDSTDA
jgi:hypothetical protein